MPELPEVETIVRDLRASGVPGAGIADVRVFWPRTVAGCSARSFTARLRGVRIESVSRRGKYIVLGLSGGAWLLVHLRMTGQLWLTGKHARRGKHHRLVLLLADGRRLWYQDTRKFGRWYILSDADTRLGALGPEPLASTFTLARFRDRLSRRRGMLKPLLLNQRFIAGLGNIYVDEALWEAGLHPRRACPSLTDAERDRLYRGIRRVLRRGIKAMGTTLGTGATNFYSVGGRRGRNQDGLRVFRRTGRPCPRCGMRVTRCIVAQRSSHVCTVCQKPPIASAEPWLRADSH